MGHEKGGLIKIPVKTENGNLFDYSIGQTEMANITNYPPEVLFYSILKQLGEDPNRDGLVDTPKRWIKFMREFLTPQEFNFTTFPAEGMDEMVIVNNIPFYSFCEHHVAPIVGFGSIAYIPNNRIVGLSKLPRTLDMFANRLQNQERITSQVAEFLMDRLDAKGVAVSLTARHYCMEMRGVKKHDTQTTTTKLLGVFHSDPSAKSEFLTKINK